MSNILDKPLESVFGFISVLPGAFSAYRFKALQDSYPGIGPLASYFLGEKMHGGGDIFSANMYLAEDRILCFELVTKRNEGWLLKYVKSAHAETDVPDSVPEFISQRRRWLNGSFFAGVHALAHFYQVWRSGHSLFRKISLMFLFFYNLINMIFSWFALVCRSFATIPFAKAQTHSLQGNFYLVFYALGSQATIQPEDGTVNPFDPFKGKGFIVFNILRAFYIFAIVVAFICSIGNRPQGSKFTYKTIFFLFAIIMAIMLFLGGWTVYITIKDAGPFATINAVFNNSALRDIAISLVATYGLYILSSILYLDPWHCITCMGQYLFLLPSFVNVLMVYACTLPH